MLSNLVFVLLCICCCNCQTFNQNDGKWNPNPEERTNSFGSQSNVKPVTTRDRPYTYEAIQGSNTNNPNSNSNFKPLAYPPTNKVAQVTDVNASENNFPKAPETLTKTTVATPGQWISNNVPKTTKAPVNELPRVPVNNNKVNNIRPVNFGNNDQQINQQTSVNNNNQQNTVAKPTSIPVNTAIRSTISPSLTSNTGLSNQQRQPINSKPTYDVTTSDPKIFFPEEDKNLNRKPISHNRQPVHSNVCDTANELLYPGDRIGDWACDCKPGYIYHPISNKCWESHRKGPCGEGQLLTLSKTSKVPECQRNDCAADSVFFKNDCHVLGSLDPCPQEHGPRPIMLTVDATTMDLTCSDLHSVKCDINDCCLGGKRPIGQNCIKV